MKRTIVLLFLLGCGPAVESTTSGGGQSASQSDGTSGANTAGAESTASTTSATTPMATLGGEVQPPPDDCACVDPGFCGGVTPECGGEELCPAIVTDCARPVALYGCAGQEVLYDEAALSCALDALANRTNGWLDIALDTTDHGSCGFEGCTSEKWRFRILGETGSALRSYCYREPPSEPEPSNSLAPLETPAYFEACKDRPSGQARVDCLFDGILPGDAIACR